jgi:DNA excision repair protein ERCC-2
MHPMLETAATLRPLGGQTQPVFLVCASHKSWFDTGMAVLIDDQEKTINLSVRDLCAEEALGGSLSAMPLGAARADLGRTLHEEYQSRQSTLIPGYLREQAVRYSFFVESYTVTLQGRIDGVYPSGAEWVIEEIKSVLSLDPLPVLEEIPVSHRWQLKVYQWLWSCLQSTREVTGQLVLVSAESGQVLVLPLPPGLEEVSEFVSRHLREIIASHKLELAHRRRKSLRADALPFPFPKMRKYQDRMIAQVESSLENRQHLLIAAPTGVGKTAAALYAALKFALKHGQQVFFLTSKTTQQRIVQETLRLWEESFRERGEADSPSPPLFTSLLLRAKEKSCANDVVFCHESRCEYARDFYGRLEESKLCERLGQMGILSPDFIYQQAVAHTLCPFELSLELMAQADLVVCDYNYIYDPLVSLQRVFENDPSRLLIIIDEAHNLYSRAREYYSPDLNLADIRLLLQMLGQLVEAAEGESPAFPEQQQAMLAARAPSRGFLRQFRSLLKELEEYFAEVADNYPESREEEQVRVEFDRERFERHEEELADLMRRYLVYRRRAGLLLEEDRILDFFFRLADFCRVLKLAGAEFVHLFDQSGKAVRLKILCLDPSRLLHRKNSLFHSVVGMSATLTPLEFYREVLGLNPDAERVGLPSPFPAENRQVFVLPEVSTTFRQRSRNAGKIARIIEQIISIREGNYFAFFPSFAFLEEVSQFLSPGEYQLLLQDRYMPDFARENLLEKLSDPLVAHLVLAVQGGIFAEGVDYPGELAIGAIVVGPGLPRVSFEQELLRQYYEEQCGRGFDYAYLFPGMNRVIQSAGRIIRSETDRGVIVLLDQRFAQENYLALLPRHWYESSPAELICRKDYLARLRDFWGGPELTRGRQIR